MSRRTALTVGALMIWIFTSLLLGVAQRPPQVERLDSALEAIVPADATVERVATGLQFAEGPVWDLSGFLLFTDVNAAIINKWSPSGKVVRFLGPAEFTQKDSAVAGVPGANGLTLDIQGRLVICDQGHRVISRLEKNGKITVLADRFAGKRFNSPNDLVYKSDGSLYFTDPPYGLDKEDLDPKKEQTVNGVYRIKKGKIELLVKDLPRPNGIAFSPDEKYIYIDNSEVKKVFMRYEVNPDGTLGRGMVFQDVSSSPEPGLPDGLKVDQRGNVYGTGPGGVWIFSPEGKHLGTIRIPEVAANCAWGEEDAQTLYITATTSVYRIRLKIPGIRLPQQTLRPSDIPEKQ